MVNFNIASVISALKNGEVIVYPTDTLYGLGADIYNESAVKKIFSIKKRPLNQPLSIAVSSINDLKNIAFIDDRTFRIAKNFLPGKLTLVLKKKKIVSDILTAGSTNIAVRIPNNSFTLQILSDFGPLTCTSANIHGMLPLFDIKDIQTQFKEKINIFIDAGLLRNKPSTIIDLTSKKVRIIREGSIPAKKILKAIM